VDLQTEKSVRRLSKHLFASAISGAGQLTSNARVQEDLRSAGKRPVVVDELLAEICPEEVDAADWADWLTGGKNPFENLDIKNVNAPGDWPSQTLSRAADRVKTHESKVAKAERQLALAQTQLAYVKAHENAALHYLVMDQILARVRPMFAMGPAWAIMRIVSAHLSDEEADIRTAMLEEFRRPAAKAQIRGERAKDSEDLMDALDLMAGHIPFERALRSAMLKVVRDTKAMQDEVLAKGRRRRGKVAKTSTINPAGLSDAHEVLEGLKRAG
jgi:hypothetical protein